MRASWWKMAILAMSVTTVGCQGLIDAVVEEAARQAKLALCDTLISQAQSQGGDGTCFEAGTPVVLELDGGAAVSMPADALPGDVPVAALLIQPLGEPPAVSTAYTVAGDAVLIQLVAVDGPRANEPITDLAAPAMVTLPYNPAAITDPADRDILYVGHQIDEQTNAWELLADGRTVDEQGQRVSGRTSKLSAFVPLLDRPPLPVTPPTNAGDTTPPDTVLTSWPPDPSASPDATFSFSGSDADSGVSGFECQLDGGAWQPCSSPKSYVGLPDGTHVFEVRAIDNAGNVDPTPAIWQWTIDTTGGGGSSGGVSGTPVRLEVYDDYGQPADATWVAFRDGFYGAWVTVPPTSTGVYSFQVTDADGAYGILVVCERYDGSNTEVTVMEGLVNELALVRHDCDFSSDPITVSGFAIGVESAMVAIDDQLGMTFDFGLFQLPFTVEVDPPDVYDVLAIPATAGTPTSMYVERNVLFAPPGPINHDIDFTGGNTVPVAGAPVSIDVDAAGSQILGTPFVSFSTGFRSAGGSLLQTGFGGPAPAWVTGGYVEPVAGLLDGDEFFYFLQVTEDAAPEIDRRIFYVIAATQAGGVAPFTITVTMPAFRGSLAFASASSGGAIPGVTIATTQDYGLAVTLYSAVIQTDGGLSWRINVTDGWWRRWEAVAATNTYLPPDPSLLPGWAPQWPLSTGDLLVVAETQQISGELSDDPSVGGFVELLRRQDLPQGNVEGFAVISSESWGGTTVP